MNSKRKLWFNYFYQIWFKYHLKFFGSLISNGKKLIAFDKFLKVKFILKNHENFDSYILFLVSMMKVTPNVILLNIKLGGASYGVPMPIDEHKRIVFGVKWVLKVIKDKKLPLTSRNIADVLISNIYNKGLALEKKHSTYKISSLNRHLLKFFN